MSEFPKRRMRRLRRSPALRALRRETSLSPNDFVCPVFVVENERDAGPVPSMPGVSRFTVAGLDREIEAIVSAGLRSVLLFGIPAHKDATGEGAARDDSVVARAIERIRFQTDRLAIITDVCLCSYTDHGHCGIITHEQRARQGAEPEPSRDRPPFRSLTSPREVTGVKGKEPISPNHTSPLTQAGHTGSPSPLTKGDQRGSSSPLAKGGERGVEASPHASPAIIDNDATLDVLGRTAVAHARAGADLVAPSGMMDGAVGAIRSALDAAGFAGGRRPPQTGFAGGQGPAQASFAGVGILSYAVKYASSFYGPFRDAADSTPAFGDRRAYQMDPANAREALEEARLDVQEGADALMVKPALPYLDVIRRVREGFPGLPLVAYQVSGEYSMIQAAAERGWLDERAVALESLTAIKRAGADLIITYFAKAATQWLREQT